MFHVAAIGVSVACVLSAATNVTARFFEPGAPSTCSPPSGLRAYPAYANIILDVLNDRAPGISTCPRPGGC